MPALRGPGRLETLRGADHFFAGRERDLGDAIVRFAEGEDGSGSR